MARKSKFNRPRRIAPRLADGSSRENWAGRLPDYIKEGIRLRAYAENKSISWFMEERVIQLFGFRKPEYAPPKKPTVEEKSEARGTRRKD